MDYRKAVGNLTDILIDADKFNEINSATFNSIDDMNNGFIDIDMTESYMKLLFKIDSTDDNGPHVEKNIEILTEVDDG